MKPASIKTRSLHRIVAPGVWLLIGGLALADTGPVSAAVSPQPAPAAAPRPVACSTAELCAGQGPTPPLLIIDTGAPDGRMAMAARLESDDSIEIEAADDFSITTGARVFQATFTGLITGTTSFATIDDVNLEMYRIFPQDSNPIRAIQVPTRTNSPSDVDFEERSASDHDLDFTTDVVNHPFVALNSVLDGINKLPNQHTGGDGPRTGEEVKISVTLNNPFVLAPGHYFFIPKVLLSDGTFFWLSTAAPPVFAGDLQAWIRDANLDPDWLRVGTDIVGAPTAPKFNASFSLSTGREIFLPVILR